MKIDFSQIEDLCRCYFKKGQLHSYQSLSGGAVNVVYKIQWGDQFYILRIYHRQLGDIEKAMSELVRHKISVPDILYFGERCGFSYAVIEYITKEHIFEIDPTYAPQLSYDLGKALAYIHSFQFSQAGLFDKGLAISTPFPEGSSPYFDYILEHFVESSLAWKRLGLRSFQLKAFIQEHLAYFPQIKGGGVLVHSDFKPANLLWDQTGATILDWEFAHSGHPLIDFAILLRHYQKFPFKILPFEKGYRENGGNLPKEWIQKARITDIINLVQLLNQSSLDQPYVDFLIDSLDLTLSMWPHLDEKIRQSCF